MHKTKVWLTTHELADQLKIPEPTVRRHCRSGVICGAIRVGKSWRIPADFADRMAQRGLN